MKKFLWIFIVLIIGLGIGAYFFVKSWQSETLPDDIVLDESGEMGTRSVTLYFGNRSGNMLISEARSIAARAHRDEEVEAVIAHLLRGPVQKGAVNSIPNGTRLHGAFYDEEEKLLYLDFNFALVSGEMGGSAMEIMTLSGILRTIAVSFPEMVHVQFLVDGLEVETLGGHIDLTRPLRTQDWL